MKISKNRLKEIIIEEMAALEEFTQIGPGTEQKPSAPKQPQQFSKSGATGEIRASGDTGAKQASELGGMTAVEAEVTMDLRKIRATLAQSGAAQNLVKIKRLVDLALQAAEEGGGG